MTHISTVLFCAQKAPAPTEPGSASPKDITASRTLTTAATKKRSKKEGDGTIKPGRHIRYAPETRMGNLFVSMLDRMGIESDRFGDSQGKLDRLTL